MLATFLDDKSLLEDNLIHLIRQLQLRGGEEFIVFRPKHFFDKQPRLMKKNDIFVVGRFHFCGEGKEKTFL